MQDGQAAAIIDRNKRSRAPDLPPDLGTGLDNMLTRLGHLLAENADVEDRTSISLARISGEPAPAVEQNRTISGSGGYERRFDMLLDALNEQISNRRVHQERLESFI